jgi:putative SOS response-associated peptidase YedK
MCGRFTLHPGDDFYGRFDISNRLEILAKDYTYSPGNITPIITHHGQNLVWEMLWGLIPFWAKDPKIGRGMFNARSESVVDKPAFRKAFKTQRCLVPANGFFEWKAQGSKKVPYYFEIKDRPLFAFAGLYDIWTEPVSGRETYSYTIITTEPNDIVSPIHDRMPVILEQNNESVWLEDSTPTNILSTLLAPSLESMTFSKIQ